MAVSFTFRSERARSRLDLRALIITGLALRDLERRDPSFDRTDHMERLGQAHADCAVDLIEVLIDVAEEERARHAPSSGALGVAYDAASYSSDRAPHSSRRAWDSSDRPSHDSRRGDSEDGGAWDESRTADSECDRAPHSCDRTSDESRREDSESDRWSHDDAIGDEAIEQAALPHAEWVRAGAAAPFLTKREGRRLLVALRGGWFRVPTWYEPIHSPIRCPDCGYDGEAKLDALRVPISAQAFHVKSEVTMVHTVVGFARDRMGSIVLLVDVFSAASDDNGFPEELRLICPSCEASFAARYPVREVRMVDPC